MENSPSHRFQVPDLLFFTVVLLLAGLGLVMVYSASSVSALEHFGDSWYYLKRQAAFSGAGIVCMFLVMNANYHRWIKWGGWILGCSILSLILIHVPGLGHRAGGALRWLSLGGIRLQPAEIAKLACVLYMSWALVRKGSNVSTFTYGLLPMLLVAGLMAGLLMLQPDFGNAVVLVSLAGVMLFLAGARVSYLGGAVLGALPLVYLAVMGEDYRRRRFLAFLNPWEDPSRTSYQIVQSFAAFFSGGFWGRGLGNSQEKLYYLPEVHTDFVGSVIGEELGFVGVAAVIVAFWILIVRGYRMALRAQDPSGFLLAAGCTTLVGLQALLNLMVITGLAPTKGLPLPFISHGGSALLMIFVACGLIQSVGRRAHLEGPVPDAPWLKRWGK
ncbi:MAG: putative lipid II flippase FtsW [Bdellovibrionales bacterium]|nr:putative lipid II flippase FtsW [Bdellovibrionales bacterium]